MLINCKSCMRIYSPTYYEGYILSIHSVKLFRDSFNEEGTYLCQRISLFLGVSRGPDTTITAHSATCRYAPTSHLVFTLHIYATSFSKSVCHWEPLLNFSGVSHSCPISNTIRRRQVSIPNEPHCDAYLYRSDCMEAVAPA